MPTTEVIQSREPILLANYLPPAWLVPRLELWFDLEPEATEVTCELTLTRNAHGPKAPPTLNGDGLELLEIELDGRALGPQQYELRDGLLTLREPPGDTAVLRTRVRIAPAENTALEGLYMSGGSFCTQNEPEGFRHITFFPDRPDVMSVYRTTIRADKKRFPVLLSNGNRVAESDLPDGRHSAAWEDPFPKPSYLFALVAGDLGVVKDSYRTASGRDVALLIYTDPGSESRCAFAMESLKKAMAWDERVFGLEYDLDMYMIVAVEAFNFGAMENKGLNIFNSRLVLADEATATDDAFERIESVIAHEYFHNWTGNRVTCRDWFQLTLKEGLTVFRDQQFSADMTQPDLQRIYDVESLRSLQFPEDAGPMAHPIQPKSYIEINNFYTMTVYEKGAEVIRMIHTLIGQELFRRGMDLYFKRHDGQAVTTEQFVAAMESASGYDLTQFRRWYDHAGTPEVIVEQNYDPATGRYELTLQQKLPDPGAPALLMPVRVALLGPDGNEQSFLVAAPLPPADAGADRDANRAGQGALRKEATLPFSKTKETFVFTGVAEKPTPSLLRRFSAPVRLEYERSNAELAFLMTHDTDAFNRHECGRELGLRVLIAAAQDAHAGRPLVVPPELVDAFGAVLISQEDESLRAAALVLPDEAQVNDRTAPCDFDATHRAREGTIAQLANSHKDQLRKLHGELAARMHADRAAGIGTRRLKNACLSLLLRLNDEAVDTLAWEQLERGANMTDELAALRTLVHRGGALRDRAVALFYERWKHESLVMDSWLAIQAAGSQTDTIERVKELRHSPVYANPTPNKARSLFGTFSRNELLFNAADGSGYALIADTILEFDSVNPSIASGLAKAFTRLTRLDKERRALAVAQLERVFERPGLSTDVYEVVSRSLNFARELS